MVLSCVLLFFVKLPRDGWILLGYYFLRILRWLPLLSVLGVWAHCDPARVTLTCDPSCHGPSQSIRFSFEPTHISSKRHSAFPSFPRRRYPPIVPRRPNAPASFSAGRLGERTK